MVGQEEQSAPEVSVALDTTPTGFRLAIRSRAIAAVDWLCGTAADRPRLKMQSRNAEIAAASDAKTKITEALTDTVVARIKSDPEFATRALENHLGIALDRQANKDAVAQLAIEDLSAEPEGGRPEASAEVQLSDKFKNRFERYAEEASTDELRQKWGRVLSAEIRKPGTFPAKVLRVIDELDSSTAVLFQTLCEQRLANVLPKGLIGELTLDQSSRLIGAELIVDPGGLSHVRKFAAAKLGSGDDIWLCSFGHLALGLTKTDPAPWKCSKEIFSSKDRIPALNVYVLTDVGLAISSILPDTQNIALSRLETKVQACPLNGDVMQFTLQDNKWLCFSRRKATGRAS